MGRAEDLDQAQAGAARSPGPKPRLEHARQPKAGGRALPNLAAAAGDRLLHPPVLRDPIPAGPAHRGGAPTVWYNDAGGVTLGIRSRSDYLRRFEQNQAWVSRSTGWGSADEAHDLDFFFRARNPVYLRAPNLSQTLDGYNIEGRYGAALDVERVRRAHLGVGPTWTHSISLRWVATDDFRYLDPGLYDNVGTVEAQLGAGVKTQGGSWSLGLRSSVGGGLAYNRDGLAASGRPELDPFYFRGFAEATARRPFGRFGVGARAYVGVASGASAAAKQRQIYFQGADPLEQLYNPSPRSRGALLVGQDFHYQSPGGAGVRGIDSRLSSAAIAALNLELERTLLTRPEARLFGRIALAAFGDVSRTLGDPSHRPPARGSGSWATPASVSVPSIASVIPASPPASMCRSMSAGRSWRRTAVPATARSSFAGRSASSRRSRSG